MPGAEDEDDEYEYVYEDAEESDKAATSLGGFGLDTKPPSNFSSLGAMGGLDIKPVMGQGIYKDDGFDYLTPGKSLGKVKNRSWSERLFYETGVCYMVGALGGGSYGLVQGYIAAANTPYRRLKLNSMLNHGGKLASNYANTFGIFALLYSCSRSYAKSKRRKNDPINDIIGVTTAGFLVGTPKGVRPAVLGAMSLGSVCSFMIWLNIKRQEYYPSSF